MKAEATYMAWRRRSCFRLAQQVEVEDGPEQQGKVLAWKVCWLELQKQPESKKDEEKKVDGNEVVFCRWPEEVALSVY